MPTVSREHSDVREVEKQLKRKNKALSELESKVKLFQRMIRNGVSTPDVDSFLRKQTKLKATKNKPSEALRKAAMRSKLDDIRAEIAVKKRERKNLKREWERKLRKNRDKIAERLVHIKQDAKMNSTSADNRNIDKYKHLRRKQRLGSEKEKCSLLNNVPENIRDIATQVNVFEGDLLPEPADGPMVCDKEIKLTQDEVAFLKRGPRYMIRNNFCLDDILLEGEKCISKQN